MYALLSCRPLLKSDAAEDDVAFCKRLTVEAGVTALPVCIKIFRVPHSSQMFCMATLSVHTKAWRIFSLRCNATFSAQVSAFYASSNPPRHLARFCFCKDDSKLEAASASLRRYFLR